MGSQLKSGDTLSLPPTQMNFHLLETFGHKHETLEKTTIYDQLFSID